MGMNAKGTCAYMCKGLVINGSIQTNYNCKKKKEHGNMLVMSCPYGMGLCTVRAKKKCPDFLSTYRYFLSTSVGTSEGTSVGTYCTVRLKHITHAKKFFTRSEQLYIHNSPAVL